MKELTNRQLQLARIPDPDGDLRQWEMFAHTINGYEAAGSFEHCAALYNDNTATTLTELSCALFFAARKERNLKLHQQPTTLAPSQHILPITPPPFLPNSNSHACLCITSSPLTPNPRLF